MLPHKNSIKISGYSLQKAIYCRIVGICAFILSSDIPIFFICSTGDTYYSALCTNIEEPSYIIVETSGLDIYQMLRGIIPMRNIFINTQHYWKVAVEENILHDKVEYCSIDSLDPSVLPDKDSYFKILTDEVFLFTQKLENQL